MYDKSDCGKHLRTYVGVSLAWWHNYKWASARIFNIFGPDFIGPLFHSIFPDRACHVNKMSHPAITTILSYMRISYPQFRATLLAAISGQNDLLPRSRALLQNLYSLLEYFIPVVSVLCCCRLVYSHVVCVLVILVLICIVFIVITSCMYDIVVCI
jgi:hypothetical protein